MIGLVRGLTSLGGDEVRSVQRGMCILSEGRLLHSRVVLMDGQTLLGGCCCGNVVVAADAISLADAGMVTVGATDLADAGADAGMLFPADHAGAVTVGVTSSADVRMVSVGVTNLADVGVASLADAGMAFPAHPLGAVTVGVVPLADAGMVTVGVTDVADTAHVHGDGVDIGCGERISTGIWCRGRTPIRNDLHGQFVGSVRCDPVGMSYTMPPDDPTDLFGTLLSGQMCPVTNVVTDWERLEAAVMAMMRRLTVNPAPPITMTQGITRSGVIAMMWTVKKDIMIHSKQGICLSRECCCFGHVRRETCGFTGLGTWVVSWIRVLRALAGIWRCVGPAGFH